MSSFAHVKCPRKNSVFALDSDMANMGASAPTLPFAEFIAHEEPSMYDTYATKAVKFGRRSAYLRLKQHATVCNFDTKVDSADPVCTSAEKATSVCSGGSCTLEGAIFLDHRQNFRLVGMVKLNKHQMLQPTSVKLYTSTISAEGVVTWTKTADKTVVCDNPPSSGTFNAAYKTPYLHYS